MQAGAYFKNRFVDLNDGDYPALPFAWVWDLRAGCGFSSSWVGTCCRRVGGDVCAAKD